MKKQALLTILPLVSALPGVLVGCMVMRLNHISAPFQNIAALLLGGLISCLCLSGPHRAKPKAEKGYTAILVCAGALCCTFLNSGIDGVHRWIRLGSLSLNAAFIFVPIALGGIDQLFKLGRQRTAYVSASLIGAILFLQPDASMVTALAMTMTSALWYDRKNRALQRTAFAILLALAAVSWFRLESPEPVSHVEGILSLSKASGWELWLASLLSLLILFCPFVAGLRRESSRPFCAGNILFYAGLLAAVCTGLFPVPLLGSGASPILGYLISSTYAVRQLKACER